jgi:mono/diheme cytochrome c family protein
MGHAIVVLMVVLVATVLAAAPASSAEASKPAGLDTSTAAFFQSHCVRCHNADTAEAELRLDRLDADLDRADVFARWQRIVQRLRAGEMPPREEPQPTAAERTAAIDVLDAQLKAVSTRRRQSGRVVLRRLNRVEYQNTLNDLFAVDVDIQDLLPEDTVALGFAIRPAVAGA